jgi:hypothetical protein
VSDEPKMAKLRKIGKMRHKNFRHSCFLSLDLSIPYLRHPLGMATYEELNSEYETALGSSVGEQKNRDPKDVLDLGVIKSLIDRFLSGVVVRRIYRVVLGLKTAPIQGSCVDIILRHLKALSMVILLPNRQSRRFCGPPRRQG